MKNKFLVVTLLLVLLACGKEKSNSTEEVKSVVYEKVEKKEYSIKRAYSGTVNTEALSNLSFRVSGTINNRIAQLGDTVKTGQILATLDPIEYQLNYQQALSNLDKGNASLAESTANFKRSEALYLENSISKASYDSATANYKSAVSSVKALEDAVNLAKVNLSYTMLTAPSDGTIGQVKSEVNQNVSPNTVVFVLNTFGERYVEFNVSQSVIGDLELGEEVQIEITSLNNLSIKGTITNIGTLSVGYGGTYPVKAKIADPLDTVKVGMTAKVIVTTDNTNKVIAVPLTAILTAPNGEKYVYVVTNLENNIGIVKKQIVILGSTTEQGSEIVSGLTDGDYVVTKGSSVLLEDQKVSLLKGAE